MSLGSANDPQFLEKRPISASNRGSLRSRSKVGDYSDIFGVYDLTALITIFDPVWGDLTGYRYTAVLTLWEMWDPPWLIEGRYSDLRSIGPGGNTIVADTGSVTSSIDGRGRLVIELVGNKPGIGLTMVVATLASGVIDGSFGCCGHISGTFTATRRPR